VFPAGFEPRSAGLTLVLSLAGDLDADDAWDADDGDRLAARIRTGYAPWLPDAAFDLNGDSVVDLEDHRIWVQDLAKTWYGDANLDGEFNTGDLVQVLEAGKYEKGWLDEWGYPQGEVAGWSEGDWNGDGVFETGDLVKALEDGGYEMGPREGAAAVPEPSSWLLIVLAVASMVTSLRRNGWRRSTR
jgi:hypothetical protein